jgi:hypothetical protein
VELTADKMGVAERERYNLEQARPMADKTPAAQSRPHGWALARPRARRRAAAEPTTIRAPADGLGGPEW